MLKSLSTREKIVKIILCTLIVFACITIFPKNFKIAVNNYDGRQTSVVLGDANTGEKHEAGYIFGKGCFWITPITKGPVKKLVVEDELEYVDEVVAYYGSVKISRNVIVGVADDSLIVDLTYDALKIGFMMALYALLCVSLIIIGVQKVVKWNIAIPAKPSILISKNDALSFWVITFFYMLVAFFISKNQLIKWIYPFEICAAGVALFIALCVEMQIINSRKIVLASSPLLGLVMAMCFNKISAFTFIDGHQAIMEQVDYAADKLRHWEKNSARLNYIIMGTFERFNIIPKLEGETSAKIIHCFIGVILFLYIVWFVTKRLLNAKSSEIKAIQFLVVFSGVFLYNNTLCALKNYNYDLFSLTFGVIAFIHILYAVRTCSESYAVSAVVFATLGTLEKVVDWPLMLLCMTTYVIIVSKDEERVVRSSFFSTCRVIMLTIALAMVSSLYIQHIVRADYFGYYTLDNLTKALQGQADLLLDKIVKDMPDTVEYVLGNVLGWIGVWFASIFFIKISKNIEKYKKSLLIIFRAMTIVIIPMVLYVAICNFIFYVTSRDLLGNGIFAGLSKEVNSLGTVLFLIVLVILVSWKFEDDHKELIAIVTVSGFYIPLVYALTDKRLEARYFNVFGLITIICALLIVLEKLEYHKLKKIAVVSVVLIVITIAELWKFCPSNLYFMPFWNVGEKQSGEYFGAGTERMVAGEYLLKYYASFGEIPDDIVVYINYGGEWNAAPEGWRFESFPSEDHITFGNVTMDDIQFGDNVYFAYTAAALKRNRYRFYPLPDAYDYDNRRFAEIHINDTWVVDLYKADDLREYFEKVVFVEK